MKELIETYELKLKHVDERIEEMRTEEAKASLGQKNRFTDAITRLTTKKYEYMAFLDDLRRVCPKEEERAIYITKKIHYCLFKKAHTDGSGSNYYFVRSHVEGLDLPPSWGIGYINQFKYVSLVGGELDGELAKKLEDEYYEYKLKYD